MPKLHRWTGSTTLFQWKTRPEELQQISKKLFRKLFLQAQRFQEAKITWNLEKIFSVIKQSEVEINDSWVVRIPIPASCGSLTRLGKGFILSFFWASLFSWKMGLSTESRSGHWWGETKTIKNVLLYKCQKIISTVTGEFFVDKIYSSRMSEDIHGTFPIELSQKKAKNFPVSQPEPQSRQGEEMM